MAQIIKAQKISIDELARLLNSSPYGIVKHARISLSIRGVKGWLRKEHSVEASDEEVAKAYALALKYCLEGRNPNIGSVEFSGMVPDVSGDPMFELKFDLVVREKDGATPSQEPDLNIMGVCSAVLSP